MHYISFLFFIDRVTYETYRSIPVNLGCRYLLENNNPPPQAAYKSERNNMNNKIWNLLFYNRRMYETANVIKLF